MNSYHPFPQTHWSLVRRAGGAGAGGGGGGDAADEEARREALATLLARYAPALRSYLRTVRRLPEDAADDLLQAFIADRLLASELLRSADAGRGQFRTLLLTSLNRFATSRFRSERLRSADPLAEGSDPPDAGPSPAAAVEAAWARTLIHGVTEAMREQCAATGRADVWAVFEGRVLAEIFEDRPPVSYEQLAARFGLQSPAQAANLLITAKRMYARLLRTAVAEYEPDEARIDAEIADLRRLLSVAPAAVGQGETQP
jgi:DNA-directed RNA polymerase specialized sigma24 family protein